MGLQLPLAVLLQIRAVMLRGLVILLLCLGVLPTVDSKHMRRASTRGPRKSAAMLAEERKVTKFFTERQSLAAEMLSEAKKQHGNSKAKPTFKHLQEEYHEVVHKINQK